MLPFRIVRPIRTTKSLVKVLDEVMRLTGVRPLRGPGELDEKWLRTFHRGERHAFELLYRHHFRTVFQAAGRVLTGADQETVVHELFCRLLTEEPLRRQFSGGSLGGWLATMAHHQAIDFQRRRRREIALDETANDKPMSYDLASALDSHKLINQFRRDVLPKKWVSLFELRFLADLPQREVAKRLRLSRTTLVYQEIQIRKLLKRFLLKREGQ